jgi:hypothetical protein
LLTGSRSVARDVKPRLRQVAASNIPHSRRTGVRYKWTRRTGNLSTMTSREDVRIPPGTTRSPRTGISRRSAAGEVVRGDHRAPVMTGCRHAPTHSATRATSWCCSISRYSAPSPGNRDPRRRNRSTSPGHARTTSGSSRGLAAVIGRRSRLPTAPISSPRPGGPATFLDGACSAVLSWSDPT